MPCLEPVDVAHLQSFTLGDPGLEAEVAAIFRRQAAVLRDCITGDSSRDARLRALHTLKGASASLGAFDLAARCQEAEQALRDQPPDRPAPRYLIDEVCGALDAVLIYLDQRVGG